MAARRKTPKLRVSGRYHVASIYRPDGRRSNISFGPTDVHTEGEVHTAFGQWVDLFERLPHKVLSYSNPYEAVKQLLDPTSIVAVGELVDKYFAWAERTLKPVGENRAHDTVTHTLSEILPQPTRSRQKPAFGGQSGSLCESVGRLPSISL